MSDDNSRQPVGSDWATILPGGANPPTVGTAVAAPAPAAPPAGTLAAPPADVRPAQAAAPTREPMAYQPAGYQPVSYPPPAFPPPAGAPVGAAPYQGVGQPATSQGIGASAQPGAGGVYPPVTAPPPWFGPPVKQRNTALVVVLSVVGGFIALAVLVAIAIPVFLNQRKPVPVTLTMPATLDGGTMLTTPAAQQAVSNFVASFGNAEAGLLTDVQAGVYKRTGSPGFVVGGGKLLHRPTSAQRDEFMTGFTKGASSQYSVTMAKVPPGPLGGTTQCGMLQTDPSPSVICISMDSSAVIVAIVYTNDIAAGTADAVQLRGDVEHTG